MVATWSGRPVRSLALPRHRASKARRRDGVAGFLVGLLLVTLALAAAVALAAQSVQ